MLDLLPYRGLRDEVEAALTILETRFDEPAYRTLITERNRRIAPFLGLTLPTWAIGFVLVYLIQTIGWLPHDAPWAYAFLPFLFMVVVIAPLRPNAARDDNRLGKALKEWAAEARKCGLT